MNKFKEFYKPKSKLLQRFWGTQVFASIMGLMIFLPVGTFASKNQDYKTLLLILCMALTGGLYCFLVYDLFFQWGASDHVKISRGTIEHKPLNGLITVLFAYIPTFFMLILYTVFLYANIKNFAAVITFIYNLLFNGMFMELIEIVPRKLNDYNHFLYLACTIPGILAGFGGYYLASIDKPLRTFFGFTIKAKKE